MSDEPSVTPQAQVQGVIDDLQSIVDDNPGTPLADKIEDAAAKTQTALDELNKTPPDKPDDERPLRPSPAIMGSR